MIWLNDVLSLDIIIMLYNSLYYYSLSSWRLKLLLKKDVCTVRLLKEKGNYMSFAKKILDIRLDKDNFIYCFH